MPHTIWYFILILSWFAFIVIWALSAFRTKKSTRSGAVGSGIFIRILVLAAALAIAWMPGAQRFMAWADLLPHSALLTILAAAGATITALGIAFAAWARFSLGRNWGMPMTLRESPELVTTGPYAYVRHPIYTGVIAAMIGTALAVGPIWTLLVAIMTAYFIVSALREEKDMLARFPDAYPAYRARTHLLIPFMF